MQTGATPSAEGSSTDAGPDAPAPLDPASTPEGSSDSSREGGRPEIQRLDLFKVTEADYRDDPEGEDVMRELLGMPPRNES